VQKCGAVQSRGADCRACFHALLAFENERPIVFGAVHHLTVASYYLQDPSGDTDAALHMWRDVLADSLDGIATPHELLKCAGRQFNGANRVRDAGAVVPAWWSRGWPITVQGVLLPDEIVSPEEYVRRARAWAAAIRSVLDRAQATSAPC
jgi:hypothetical protein